METSESTTTRLPDHMPAPLHELHEKYWSKAKQAPEKELAKAMKKAGYSTDFIIAGLKRMRRIGKQEVPLANVRSNNRAPRKKHPKRVLHARYMHTKSQGEALEDL